MSLHVHAVQFDIAWEDKPTNFQRVHSMLEAAAPAPGGLIVLPEMFATGFSMNLCQTLDANDETTAFIRSLAQQHQCCVVAGLVSPSKSEADKGCNQAIAIAPDGSELARYTKLQPFTLSGENQVHTAGQETTVFQWQGISFALLICYDLRFPEHARAAVAQGAEALIYIASWPAARTQHWITLLQARAIENQAWVIGVNRCGTDPSLNYPGRSIIVDPLGTIIADAADRSGVLQAVIDEAIARRWRLDFPALQDMHQP